MSWHLDRLASFDLETTSADPEQALIVEAFVGYVGGGKDPVEARVLAPVEVPDEGAWPLTPPAPTPACGAPSAANPSR